MEIEIIKNRDTNDNNEDIWYQAYRGKRKNRKCIDEFSLNHKIKKIIVPLEEENEKELGIDRDYNDYIIII